MSHLLRGIAAAATIAVVCSLIGAPARSDVQIEQKGTMIDFDGLCSRTPASWKQETPTNPMRLMQFTLPKVASDAYDAELVIYQSMDGISTQKIERWKGQFIPPEGKSLDDVATVTFMKVATAEITYLDVYGTYKYRDQSLGTKEEQRPSFRLIGVVFASKGSPYHIRLVGPAKTIAQYKKGFDDWLLAFR